MPVMDDNPFSAPQTTSPQSPQAEPPRNDRYWFMRPGHPAVLGIIIGMMVVAVVGIRFGTRGALLTVALWIAVIVAVVVVFDPWRMRGR
jgi:hypothetical protein